MSKVIRGRFNLASPGGKDCPMTIAELFDWFRSQGLFEATVSSEIIVSEDEPSVDERDVLWVKQDSEGRNIGLYVWNAKLSKFVLPAQVGELRTFKRSAEELADDIAERDLAGWYLADGTTAGVADLTGNTAFFTGTSPDWDIYTLCYTGT